MVLFVD